MGTIYDGLAMVSRRPDSLCIGGGACECGHREVGSHAILVAFGWTWLHGLNRGGVDVCGACGFETGVKNEMLSMSTQCLSCEGDALGVLVRRDKELERVRCIASAVGHILQRERDSGTRGEKIGQNRGGRKNSSKVSHTVTTPHNATHSPLAILLQHHADTPQSNGKDKTMPLSEVLSSTT